MTENENIIKDAEANISIIEESIEWADRYGKDSFPRNNLKKSRRRLKYIIEALKGNCSAAAYGESQVGKSYLMSSLLSSADATFKIKCGDRSYSFIDAINPSGGNNTKSESTGVVTRFTIRKDDEQMKDFVRVKNLSVVDIILILADSYYQDVKINIKDALLHDQINERLKQKSEIWADKTQKQSVITEDDIKDIMDYLYEVIGQKAANLYNSDFGKVISESIQYIPYNQWVSVFGLIWNENPDLNDFFNTIVNEFRKIDFRTEIYIPFDAVLREKGTLLKIEWLDYVCGMNVDTGKDELYTDIYSSDGRIIAKDFKKAYLSALIEELTFVLPEEIANDRKFLKKLDLLDFPGARSREEFCSDSIKSVLPTMLRRGKVAYLFNKYSRSLKISAVLFCHHNDQKTEPSIGSTINDWIKHNIGDTPEKRAENVRNTNGIAPLFMICTKFNIDLERRKIDNKGNDSALDEHWTRFDKTIPEIISSSDCKWFDDWVSVGGIYSSKYFQNLYLLRDFYWSAKNGVFDGYSEKSGTKEKSVHIDADYPDYFTRLKASFLKHPFVHKHFVNPESSWNAVATINNDGSKTIIRSLDEIAQVLEEAKRKQYRNELLKIRKEISDVLEANHQSKDKEENNRKLTRIVGDIKLAVDMEIGEKPELFGRIIDKLMVSSSDIRAIVYDILVRHMEQPEDTNPIKTIRALCGIDVNDDEKVNIDKLCRQYNKDEDELESFFKQKGLSLQDIISDKTELTATIPDVITKHIIRYWNEYINEQTKEISDILPHSEEFAQMLMTLLEKLGVRRDIIGRINEYYNKFDRESEVPNVIADYASLTLNNFTSTAGRRYMTDADISVVEEKAAACQMNIDLSPEASSTLIRPRPLLDVLAALDKIGEEIKNPLIRIEVLKSLPFWDSYQRWQNFMTIGFLCAGDISKVDPVANAKIESLINMNSNLYN